MFWTFESRLCDIKIFYSLICINFCLISCFKTIFLSLSYHPKFFSLSKFISVLKSLCIGADTKQQQQKKMGKSQRSGGSMKTTFNLNNFSNVAFCTQNRKTTVKAKHENTKKVQSVRGRGWRISENVLIAIISLIALFVAVYAAYRYAECSQMSRKCMSNSKLRLLLIAPVNSTAAINHVFEQLDYEIVHDTREQWDVLWSAAVDAFNQSMTELKPQQLVIHFPSDIINISSQHHLRVFKLPEMKREMMDDKEQRFIVRDCHLADDVNYEKQSVLIELMRDPLIVNDSLVEISSFALVTSTNPLRIYRPRDEFRIAFTPNYRKLSKHFCLKSLENEKSAESIKNHRSEIDNNIDNAIVATMLLLNERQSDRSNSQQSLLLMQFKFVIDTSFRVHIVNVQAINESTRGYEKIIYGSLKIAGAGNIYEFSCR